jgi:CBS domain-containing protein
VLLLKRSVLTEKIARHDMHLTREYSIDPLEVLFVRDVMRTDIIYFRADTPLGEAAARFVAEERDVRDEHHRRLYPILDTDDRLVGIVTRRQMLHAAIATDELEPALTLETITIRDPVVTYADITLREAANFMADSGVTRMPVVRREAPDELLGVVTLVNLLDGRLIDLQEERESTRFLRVRRLGLRRQRDDESETELTAV